MGIRRFQLLLQDPEDPEAFGDGLDAIEGERGEVGERSVAPKEGPRTLRSHASLNDLSQGWGVLYPEGRTDLLDAVRPLMTHREAQVQAAWRALPHHGEPPTVQSWPIPTGWRGSDFVLRVHDLLSFEERPGYLLILGDLDEISLDLQLDLAGRLAVGRLCFPDVGGYQRYVKKLIDSEETPAKYRSPRLLLFSSSHPARRDLATDDGHQHLIEPTRRLLAKLSEPHPSYTPGQVHLTGPRASAPELQSWAGLAGLAQAPEPSVLLSLSHGAGSAAWSYAEQRANQGKLKVGWREWLDPDALAEGAFLPGGAWFMYACFGAGTPHQTAYGGFLSELVRAGQYKSAPKVMKTLSKGAPFIAQTPMAALSNPDGPLVVFAHADLAFSYAYATLGGQHLLTLPGGQAPVPNPFQGGKPYIAETLKQLGQGKRAGYAIGELDRVVQFLETLLTGAASQEINEDEALKDIVLELCARPDAEGALPERIREAGRELLERAGGRLGVDLRQLAAAAGLTVDALRASLSEQLVGEHLGALERVSRSERYMARNDLRAFILLGDPAATLPLKGTRPKRELSLDEMIAAFTFGGASTPTPAPTPAPSPFGALSPDEAAALARSLIGGTRTAQEVADESGLSVGQVRELTRVFDDAGRAALARLLGESLEG